MRNWLITTEAKQPEYYKGMLIHADTGVHDQAISLFQKYVPNGSGVLDVGAGAGAFSQRLLDSGYAVTALDVDRGKWAAIDIPFMELDINRGIKNSVDTCYDAACCLEVIEHVENPWSLMRELYAVVKPGGRMILSTPNVTSFLSRLTFLRQGRFHQFGDADLAYGHVSPITEFELSTIAHRTGWRIVSVEPGGYLPVFDFTRFSPRPLLFSLLRGLAYWVAKGAKRGWCLFFVMEKPALG